MLEDIKNRKNIRISLSHLKQLINNQNLSNFQRQNYPKIILTLWKNFTIPLQ